MKLALSALAFVLPAFASATVPAPRTPNCQGPAVLAAVNQRAPDAYRPGARASVRFAGPIAVGETLNVMVLVDDFNLKNTYGRPVEAFVIVGSSLASDTTAWIAIADAQTCELKETWEALHTGGGGL